MYDLYVPEIYRPCAIFFAADTVGLSSFTTASPRKAIIA